MNVPPELIFPSFVIISLYSTSLARLSQALEGPTLKTSKSDSHLWYDPTNDRS
jgi:hypothetical protein